MYLTFEEYGKMGGSLSKEDFGKYTELAEAKIKNATFNRAEESSKAVRACVKHLAELFYGWEKSGGSELSSVSHDGMSLSFKDITFENREKETQRVINDFLEGEFSKSGVPLLYRGCGR